MWQILTLHKLYLKSASFYVIPHYQGLIVCWYKLILIWCLNFRLEPILVTALDASKIPLASSDLKVIPLIIIFLPRLSLNPWYTQYLIGWNCSNMQNRGFLDLIKDFFHSFINNSIFFSITEVNNTTAS